MAVEESFKMFQLTMYGTLKMTIPIYVLFM